MEKSAYSVILERSNCMEKIELHSRQINTNKKTIYEIMWEESKSIIYNTILLLMLGEVTPDYKLRLYSVSSKLYLISSLVYTSKGWVSKPSEKEYIKRLFESRAETEEEVREIIEYWCDSLNISFELVYKENYVYEKLLLLEKILGRILSNRYEQPFLHEIAYVYEYVYNAPSGLPDPVYFDEFSLFPENYINFDYTRGIANYFDKIDFAV